MYGDLFPKLRTASQPNWDAYVNHAFVQGLQKGSLPRAAFQHYMRQDYVFLVHFSRAWALAVVKADTVDEMKLAAGTLDALVNHEMALHVETCATWGISETELFETEEHPANLAYTRYVLDAGLSGDFLDIIMALAPCVLGYGEIGLSLKADHAPDTPYKNWIDTYAGDEYQDACQAVGALLDHAVERRLGATPHTAQNWPHFQKRFNTATRLEVGFWDMALNP